MSRSKTTLLLLMLFALFVAACGGAATPTRTAAPTEDSAAATTEAEAATEEATEPAAEDEPTEEATEEAAEDEPTEEATEAATEEMATEEAATEEATEMVAEATVEETQEVAIAATATKEPATEEPTEEATVEVAMAETEEATEEAVEVTMEAATDEPTEEPTEEMATEEATVEATIEPTEEPTEAATEEMATEEATSEAPVASGDLTPVSLQLQWVAQSQFCGYYAAEAQGFYEDAGLDVTILEGAVDIVPQQVVAAGGAQFGIAWVPKVLESRAAGADLVNIAQIFQRSGTLEVSFVDKGIESVEDLRGMRVGTWGFGNEHELFAALRGADIDPDNPDDVTIVQQPFDMSLLLNDEVDAAEAMTYNEYAQVLEQENPDTGDLYQPEDLNVIDFNEVGTAMLQDHIFTTESWLAEEGSEETAIAFIKASIQGWIYCRDNFADAVDIVLANGPTLGQGHMTWQLNEINKLIWPSPAGIGVMDEALWDQTVQVAVDGGVIAEEPSEGAYRTDLVEAALEELRADDVDVTGEDWEAETVEITPGGE
jgi:NitT/TauT family transport system substrate-binding protein